MCRGKMSKRKDLSDFHKNQKVMASQLVRTSPKRQVWYVPGMQGRTTMNQRLTNAHEEQRAASLIQRAAVELLQLENVIMAMIGRCQTVQCITASCV